MKRTFTIAALTLGLAASSVPTAVGSPEAGQAGAGSGQGTGNLAPKATRDSCFASFTSELQTCQTMFPSGPALEICTGGAKLVLEHCLASI